MRPVPIVAGAPSFSCPLREGGEVPKLHDPLDHHHSIRVKPRIACASRPTSVCCFSLSFFPPSSPRNTKTATGPSTAALPRTLITRRFRRSTNPTSTNFKSHGRSTPKKLAAFKPPPSKSVAYSTEFHRHRKYLPSMLPPAS